MHIICLTPIEEGVYNDHKANYITAPPEGWAMIPEDFELPKSFPRLSGITAEEVAYPYEVKIEDKLTGKVHTERKVRKMMTVTSMTEGTIPEPAPIIPTQLDIIEAQVAYTALLTDTMLEV